MAIVGQRAFGDLSVKPERRDGDAPAKETEGLDSVRLVTQAARELQPIPLAFPESGEERGFGLQSLKLLRGFEGLIGNLFKNDAEIYFLAWAYDLSGEPPWLYPGPGFDAEELQIKLESGDVRQFLGQGVLLFPARKVRGGISLRIQVWESDRGARTAGKTIEDVAKAIDDSQLTNLLSLIAMAGGPTTATLALIRDAATELAKVVGGILKGNSNDLVDYFEGYYPASDPWSRGDETHSGHGTEIVLSRL
jgi:hypothetical protein